jgi:CDGSH-type Zn-finger protein
MNIKGQEGDHFMCAEKRNIKQSSDSKYRIKITPNGPLIVTGGVPLAEQSIKIDEEGDRHGWQEGKKYPLQESYALCRCGKSKNMPFCDGSHLKTNFNGAETASREPYLRKAEKIKGPDLDLTDNESLCAVARFCHRAGGIWNLIGESDDPEARKIAIEIAADCPSGRLITWDKKGKSIEPHYEPSIGLVEDGGHKPGPIRVRGGIPVESANGTTYEIRNQMTLCRCGKSQNKPFCDGRHLR